LEQKEVTIGREECWREDDPSLETGKSKKKISRKATRVRRPITTRTFAPGVSNWWGKKIGGKFKGGKKKRKGIGRTVS